MNGRVNCEPGADDWASGGRAVVLWWLPSAILLVTALLGGPYLQVVWPGLLGFMGIACLLNARRCGRIHCYLTGPFFLGLAIISLLHGLDVVSLGEKGWWILSVIFVIGGAALTYVPEWLLGRYRSSQRNVACC